MMATMTEVYKVKVVDDPVKALMMRFPAFRPYKNTKVLARKIKASCYGEFESLAERYPKAYYHYVKLHKSKFGKELKGITKEGKIVDGLWKEVSPGVTAWRRYIVANGLRRYHRDKIRRIIGTMAMAPRLMSAHDIAKILKLHPMTVSRHMASLRKKHGLDVFPRGKRGGGYYKGRPKILADLSEDTVWKWNDMNALKLKGWSMAQIGEKYGVSRQRVHQILTRRGVLEDNAEEMRTGLAEALLEDK